MTRSMRIILIPVAIFFASVFIRDVYSRAYPDDPEIAKILDWCAAHDQGSRWTATGRAICEEAYGALKMSAAEAQP